MKFRRRWPLRCAVSLFVLGTLAVTAIPAAGQSQNKRVLILFDEDKTLPGLSILDQSIRSTLSAGLGEGVEFFTESMNDSQFPEPQHELALRDYFLRKYGSRKLDLIVGVMGPSLKFLLRHGDTFAPGVPIVFCGADARDLEGSTLPANTTGLLVRRVFAPTLEIALRLQPDAREVYVVGGTSEFDRNLQAAARREFEPFERRLSFTYLTDAPMNELLTAVSRVPRRSVILWLSLFRDGAGDTFVPHDAVSRISVAASAPVYVFVDQYLGLGPVGGYLYSLELHGRASGELGLRVLRGESPATIPVREVADNQFMFDVRQLNRWTLDSRRLPAESVIKFRDPSAWDLYRGYIVSGLTLLTVQTSLIVGLLLHRAKRRRAESELRASVARVRELGRRLLTAQETERTRIAQELHDDIGQQLAMLYLDLHDLAGMAEGATETIANDAMRHADDITTSVRNLSHQLYPVNLRLVGLVPALRSLVGEFSRHNSSITFTYENVPTSLPLDLSERLPNRAGSSAECAQAQSGHDNLRARERQSRWSRIDRGR